MTATLTSIGPADMIAERVRLKHALVDAEARAEHIRSALRFGVTEFQGQELASELSQTNGWIARLRADLDRLARFGDLQLSKAEANRITVWEQTIEREIASRRETALAFIARLEEQRDFRQAKIHSLALLDLPQQVIHEYPAPQI